MSNLNKIKSLLWIFIGGGFISAVIPEAAASVWGMGIFALICGFIYSINTLRSAIKSFYIIAVFIAAFLLSVGIGMLSKSAMLHVATISNSEIALVLAAIIGAGATVALLVLALASSSFFNK